MECFYICFFTSTCLNWPLFSEGSDDQKKAGDQLVAEAAEGEVGEGAEEEELVAWPEQGHRDKDAFTKNVY